MAQNYRVPPGMKFPKDNLEKPKSLKEYPAYLIKKVKNFTSRLFYIVTLVWESSPLLLITLSLFCALDGFLPIIGAYISKSPMP